MRREITLVPLDRADEIVPIENELWPGFTVLLTFTEGSRWDGQQPSDVANLEIPARTASEMATRLDRIVCSQGWGAYLREAAQRKVPPVSRRQARLLRRFFARCDGFRIDVR